MYGLRSNKYFLKENFVQSNSFQLSISSKIMIYISVEENVLFDFRGIRLDWFRLQVLHCISYLRQTFCQFLNVLMSLCNVSFALHCCGKKPKKY